MTMTLAVAACMTLGLLVGSFLNVVIWRVPRGESVVRPPSHCPGCDAPIAPRDNVPVVSWLLLRGRCRGCGAAISLRYPLVELTTGVLFAVVGWRLFDVGLAWAVPAYLYLAAAAVALALIDIDTGRLPVAIVRPSFAVAAVLLGLASFAHGDPRAAVRAALGMVALYGFYATLHFLYPAGMGWGDVRLSGLLGMYLAWLGWSELLVGGFLAFLLGGVMGVVQAALTPDWEKRARGGATDDTDTAGDIPASPGGAPVSTARAVLRRRIPYGPYMLAGALIAVFAGEAIGTWYLDLMGL